MSQIVTKTGLAFDDFRVHRQLSPDGKYTYSIAVGYRVDTDDEPIQRDRLLRLTGTQATQAAAMFDTIASRINAVEGLP